MYINSICMREFRTFKRSSVEFIHPQLRSKPNVESTKLRNINLVIGANGSGKTTLLKGIALAALGPAVAESGIFPYHLVRREAGQPAPGGAFIEAAFTPNAQDRNRQFPDRMSRIESRVRVDLRGDLERFKWMNSDDKPWHPIYSDSSDAFFFVGYGANRQVAKVHTVDEAGRRTFQSATLV